MSGFFAKSPASVAETLSNISMEVGLNISDHNFLQLPRDSLAYARYATGAQVFSSLICQHLVDTHENDGPRAMEICSLIVERHIAGLSKLKVPMMRVGDIVVWDEEIDSIRRYAANPAFRAANLSAVTLPLSEIVREIYLVRRLQMVKDNMRGAAVVLDQKYPLLGGLKPVCSSLIMQT